jgi:hypothetical protein
MEDDCRKFAKLLAPDSFSLLKVTMLVAGKNSVSREEVVLQLPAERRKNLYRGQIAPL